MRGKRQSKFWDILTFTELARYKHGDKFNYSEVALNGASGKITIICPVHGEFEQTANGHLRYGCKDCNPRKKKSREDFIKEAITVHGDKFDYSLVEYKRTNIKVKIICPFHGVFEQSPSNHLEYDCARCMYDKKFKTTRDFIVEAKVKHGDKFDYSLVEYNGSDNFVSIICRKHGVFEQKARVHTSGHGCQSCVKESISEKNTKTTEDFIRSAKVIHDSKYDYSLVDYTHSASLVKIKCRKHGIFEQKPRDHLSGSGCLMCAEETRGLHSLKDMGYFIDKARETHGDKYDYSISVYEGANKSISIKCPIHGIFSQRVTDHYVSGCAKCGHVDTFSRSKYIDNSESNHNGMSKLYFIEVFDDVESFYKIGISVYDIHERFSTFKQMPYDFHEVISIEDSASIIWDLETHLHKTFGMKLYTPLVTFGGSAKECFDFNDDEVFDVLFEIDKFLSGC